VELFEQIRKDRRVDGSSIRELADGHHVHRRTVRQALESAVPPPRRPYPQRPRPAIDAYATVIDSWLLADKEVPRKQRHTARRVWQRLVAEHGAACSEVTVSRYVARRRTELGLQHVEVAVPQSHLPGAEAEVDFGEFHAMIAGVVLKLWLFVLRLSCSGRAFHVGFATQAQEAFLEGHVLAFEHFGAVPGRIRYDNLKPAVARVLKGRDRAEAERFIALRSHYPLTEQRAELPQFRGHAGLRSVTVRRHGGWRRCGGSGVPGCSAVGLAGGDRRLVAAVPAA